MSGELIWHLTCFVKTRGQRRNLMRIVTRDLWCDGKNMSVLSSSFDANMGLWFYSRITWAQTSSLVYLDLMPGPGTIICWELFRLRSVTREEDLFFVSEKEETYFHHLLPSLEENNKGTFLPEQLGRLSDSVFSPLSSNILYLLL